MASATFHEVWKGAEWVWLQEETNRIGQALVMWGGDNKFIFTQPCSEDLPRIEAVKIEESHRNQGFGKALMLVIEQRAVDLKVPRLTLAVNENNRPAMALYHSVGFVKDADLSITSVHSSLRSELDSLILMRKEL